MEKNEYEYNAETEEFYIGDIWYSKEEADWLARAILHQIHGHKE